MFLDRVVRYLVGEAGLAQFLDLGSGLPTQGNVSEVAHEVDPAVHVVHVDNDPVVYTHGKALLADKWTTDVVVGDIRRPGEILDDPSVRKLIDFGQPAGRAAAGDLAPHPGPRRPGADYRRAQGRHAAGQLYGHLQLPHVRPRAPGTAGGDRRGREAPRRHARQREDEEILSWFGDWELLRPGLVPLLEWRPPPGGRIARDELDHSFFGGVARKPAKPAKP